MQILGFLSATLVFSLQFAWLHAMENTASKLRRWVLNVSGNQVLAVIGLVSTVSNLRAVWYLLDIFIFPRKDPLFPFIFRGQNPILFSGNLLMSLSLTFSFAFTMLLLLGCVSSLHGGIVKDPGLKDGFLVPGFYATFFVMKAFAHARGDMEVDTVEKGPGPLPKVSNF